MKAATIKAGQQVIQVIRKPKPVFWYIVIAITILVIVYFWGKGKGKTEPHKYELPGGTQDIPAGWNVNPLLQDLYWVVDSNQYWDNWERRENILQQIAELPTDAMFVYIVNAFNEQYQQEGKGTLRERIEAEKFMNAWPAVDSGGANEAGRVIERMKTFNIV